MPSYDYHRGYQIELLSEPGARPRWLARDASGFNLGTIEPTAGFRAFIASRVGLSGCTVTAIRGDQQAAASWLARQRNADVRQLRRAARRPLVILATPNQGAPI